MSLNTHIKILIRKKKTLLINSILIVAFTPSLHAEGLGRLFTTPKERAMLERMRNPLPKPPIQKEEPLLVVEHREFEPPKSEYSGEVIAQEELYPDLKPEIVVIPAPEIPNITVNGFVKRSGGRSTAWVNGINTNDGYFEPQHIKVNPHRVGRDHVHVEVDDINIGEVSLKVGQTLDPKSAKITDTYQVIGKANSQ